jgi:hypothetical protein
VVGYLAVTLNGSWTNLNPSSFGELPTM